MRWKELLVGLVLMLVVVAGCQKQCYMTECDLNQYQHLGLPAFECDPSAAMVPSERHSPRPATVDEPAREPLYLTLSQAIAMSLENGVTGTGALTGTTQNFIATSQGGRPPIFGGDTSVRVLALDPAIAGTDIEASLSKFDARWVTSMAWQVTDQPSGGNFLQNFSNGESAAFSSSLVKPLPTGGVAGITFRTNYLLLNQPPLGFNNPQYRPFLQFQFDQPLLQGYGIEINQLRSTHPGTTQGVPGLNPGAGFLPFLNTGGRVEGILITHVRFDQQRAEFERQIHDMLANVEIAYWNLYGAYWDFYSREAALRQAFETWRFTLARYEVGRIAIQDLAQARAQYESFRAQRIASLDAVLQSERQIRMLVGLPIEDGKRIIPIDKPTLAPFVPDWDTALNETMALRPEMVLARNELKLRQFDLRNQRNLLLPDIRMTSSYDFNGIGTMLDGGSNNPNNAFANLANGSFSDWSLGLRADIPIGFRDAHAGMRAARLRLAQSYLLLQNQERRLENNLAGEYQRLPSFYNQIQAQRAQRLAAAEQLIARFNEYIAGRATLGDFLLLQAQQTWADALRNEFIAIVNYNNAIVRFEWGKGTIMQHDNVYIAEGSLPRCAQVRAVEHERERSKALALRERADPVQFHGCDPDKGLTGLPALTGSGVPSLAALFDGAPSKDEPAGLPKLLPNKAQPLPAGTPAPKKSTVGPAEVSAPPAIKWSAAFATSGADASDSGPALPTAAVAREFGRPPSLVKPQVLPALVSEPGPSLPVPPVAKPTMSYSTSNHPTSSYPSLPVLPMVKPTVIHPVTKPTTSHPTTSHPTTNYSTTSYPSLPVLPAAKPMTIHPSRVVEAPAVPKRSTAVHDGPEVPEQPTDSPPAAATPATVKEVTKVSAAPAASQEGRGPILLGDPDEMKDASTEAAPNTPDGTPWRSSPRRVAAGQNDD